MQTRKSTAPCRIAGGVVILLFGLWEVMRRGGSVRVLLSGEFHLGYVLNILEILSWLLPAAALLIGRRNAILPAAFLFPLLYRAYDIFRLSHSANVTAHGVLRTLFSLYYPELFFLAVNLILLLLALGCLPGAGERLKRWGRRLWLLPALLAVLGYYAIPYVIRLFYRQIMDIFGISPYADVNGIYALSGVGWLLAGLWMAFPEGLVQRAAPPAAPKQPMAAPSAQRPAPPPPVRPAAPPCPPLRQGTVPQQGAAQGVDQVEELRRYKALLDEGVITQEEFEAKKKQLLGI